MARRKKAFNPTIEENFNPFLVILGSVLFTGLIQWIYTPSELISPYISHNLSVEVQAKEIEPIIEVVEVVEPKTDKEKVKAYILEVFGEDGEDALTVSHCESKYVASVQGDTNIMVLDPKYNEMVGDSIGVFQIRTGGQERNGIIWNRARANGLTADQFRAKLRDYRYNIDYAKSIFDRQGWSPWTCKRDLN